VEFSNFGPAHDFVLHTSIENLSKARRATIQSLPISDLGLRDQCVTRSAVAAILALPQAQYAHTSGATFDTNAFDDVDEKWPFVRIEATNCSGLNRRQIERLRLCYGLRYLGLQGSALGWSEGPWLPWVHCPRLSRWRSRRRS
jgi:hypothetical protein